MVRLRGKEDGEGDEGRKQGMGFTDSRYIEIVYISVHSRIGFLNGEFDNRLAIFYHITCYCKRRENWNENGNESES